MMQASTMGKPETVSSFANFSHAHFGKPDLESQRKKAIEEFQYRLVLLHHTSTCPFSNSKPQRPCRAFQLCRATFELLCHTKECEDVYCERQHCRSTQFLLTHSKNCSDSACFVCKPLKDVIARKRLREHCIIDRSVDVASGEKRKREDDEQQFNMPSYVYSRNHSFNCRCNRNLCNEIETDDSFLDEDFYDNILDSLSDDVSTTSQAAAVPFSANIHDKYNWIHNDTSIINGSPVHQPSKRSSYAFGGELTNSVSPSGKLIYYPCSEHISSRSGFPHPDVFSTLTPSTSWSSATTRSIKSRGCSSVLSRDDTEARASACTQMSSTSCSSCSMQILSGYRYFCAICNTNFCPGCFHGENDIEVHEHPMKPYKITSS